MRRNKCIMINYSSINELVEVKEILESLDYKISKNILTCIKNNYINGMLFVSITHKELLHFTGLISSISHKKLKDAFREPITSNQFIKYYDKLLEDETFYINLSKSNYVKELNIKLKKLVLLQHDVKEFNKLLNQLDVEHLKNIACVFENILSDLDRVVSDFIYFIDVEICQKMLDDLYYKTIVDYKEYFLSIKNKLENYLYNNIRVVNNNLLLNKEEIKNPRNIEFINKAFPEELKAYIFNKYNLLVNYKQDDLAKWNLFKYPNKPYSYHVIKNIEQEVRKYILYIQCDLNKDTINNSSLFSLVYELRNSLEYYTSMVIDTDNLFYKHLTEEQCELLRKYNCLDKIGLIVKYPSIYQIEGKDIFEFLKNTEVLKVIDNGIEHVLKEGTHNKLIVINLTKDYGKCDTLKLYEEMEKEVIKYGCQESFFPFDGRGNNKKLIILLRTI